MGNIYATLVHGLLFVRFGNRIGMTPFDWGLLNSISSLLLGADLLSALLAQRVGRRKLIWFVSSMVCRSLRFLAVLVALLLNCFGSAHASAVLICGVCLSNFFAALATPPWLSWLADLVPARDHGAFWGRRAAWIDFSNLCVLMPACALVDWVPEAWKTPTLIGVFVVALAIGVVDLIVHSTLPEPDPQLPPRTPMLRQIAEPLRDRGFRPWLWFNVCWTFSMALGGSLSLVYFDKYLGIDKNLLGGAFVLAALPTIGSMLTGARSGARVDRLGPKRVLLWGHFFWSIFPAFWIFATPRTALFWLGCAGFISGTASRAAMVATNKLITRYPPRDHCAMYVAVSSLVGNLAAGIGSLAAGSFVHALRGWSFPLFGWTFMGFHILFVASVVLRLASALLLIPRLRNPEIPKHA
jgi:MFS family permease